jgi:hypothetical protein
VSDANESRRYYGIRAGSAQARNRRATRRLLGLDDSRASADTPSDLVNEPFGFVSSAEGFVFLSALLVARLYIRQAAEAGAAVRTKRQMGSLRVVNLIVLSTSYTGRENCSRDCS